MNDDVNDFKPEDLDDEFAAYNDAVDFAELLEASSLGTPEAVETRALGAEFLAADIVARPDLLDAGHLESQSQSAVRHVVDHFDKSGHPDVAMVWLLTSLAQIPQRKPAEVKAHSYPHSVADTHTGSVMTESSLSRQVRGKHRSYAHRYISLQPDDDGRGGEHVSRRLSGSASGTGSLTRAIILGMGALGALAGAVATAVLMANPPTPVIESTASPALVTSDVPVTPPEVSPADGVMALAPTVSDRAMPGAYHSPLPGGELLDDFDHAGWREIIEGDQPVPRAGSGPSLGDLREKQKDLRGIEILSRRSKGTAGVYAVEAGVVTQVDATKVVLEHLNGTRSAYEDVRTALVHAGESVPAGQRIAVVDDKLRFEVSDAAGTNVDELAWLRERGIDPSRF